ETNVEHFDCLIHNGALYIKNLVARRSHLMPEFSVMVNEGIITKEQAIGMLKQKPNEKIAKKELKLFCKFAGLSYNWTMFKAKIYSKRWW
ncbi:MAG: hypothetical protein IJF10_04815, partial [Clostridia bacterium]|nr:hypothetical protein [Clostridia bacterium]